jgi:hypothetical protein
MTRFFSSNDILISSIHTESRMYDCSEMEHGFASKAACGARTSDKLTDRIERLTDIDT